MYEVIEVFLHQIRNLCQSVLSNMLLTLILAVALSVGTLIFLLGRFFSVPQDRLEPTLIQSTIPVVGHAINLLRHGTGYYSHVM